MALAAILNFESAQSTQTQWALLSFVLNWEGDSENKMKISKVYRLRAQRDNTSFGKGDQRFVLVYIVCTGIEH